MSTTSTIKNSPISGTITITPDPELWWTKHSIANSGDCMNSPLRMPKETKTYVYSHDGSIRLATYKDGVRFDDLHLINDIADVQVIDDKVIIVTFTDGGVEKAVVDTIDDFSIERGITTCIVKKIISTLYNKNSDAVYNKLINHGIKTYNRINTAKAVAEAEKIERELRKKKYAEKAKLRKERKLRERREAEIEIQKEAYIRAMRELANEK